MKLRVLFCGEFSLLNTGYAVYGKELLSRLHATGKYEVAELASYVTADDPRIHSLPWKVYPVIPSENSKQSYNTSSSDQFGASAFDNVCLDFKPHVVIDIRDFWMIEHESISPARPYYSWFIMPTVDSYPQQEQWLATYSSADAVFTYQDWSLNILNKEGGGNIKTVRSAPPVANEIFYPLGKDDRSMVRERFGFANKDVIGTVMRNQGRKLFPYLFQAFSEYIKYNENAVLYCHTSYPDLGWDLPKYLNKYGIINKVYFTYTCHKNNNGCGYTAPSVFNDIISICPNCKKPNYKFISPQLGVDDEFLSIIYNIFDLYVQYSNSEGFGMPQVEAAACGVPLSGIYFSAMEDILEKLEGYKIKVAILDNEIETGCLRAIPDIDSTVSVFKEYFSLSSKEKDYRRYKTRMNFEEVYTSWNKTASYWMNELDKINVKLAEAKWNTKGGFHTPSNNIPEYCSNSEFARFLIVDVLGKPEFVNSYMECRLIKDLNYQQTSIGINGAYFNEMGALFNKPVYVPFNRDIAYKHFMQLSSNKNLWEEKRNARIIHSSL